MPTSPFHFFHEKVKRKRRNCSGRLSWEIRFLSDTECLLETVLWIWFEVHKQGCLWKLMVYLKSDDEMWVVLVFFFFPTFFPHHCWMGRNNKGDLLKWLKNMKMSTTRITSCNKTPSRLEKDGVENQLQIWSPETSSPEPTTRFWNAPFTSDTGCFCVLCVLICYSLSKGHGVVSWESDCSAFRACSEFFSHLEVKFLVFIWMKFGLNFKAFRPFSEGSFQVSSTCSWFRVCHSPKEYLPPVCPPPLLTLSLFSWILAGTRDSALICVTICGMLLWHARKQD